MSSDDRLRYVALGDSQTEGVGDGDDTVGLRGFADRLAETLAVHNSGVHYANLAVRGRLAGQVREEQLAPALALRPGLATVVAGVNDLLRPRFDADEVAGHLEAMFEELTARGARVATVTFPDVTRLIPLARPVGPRVTALNHRIRQAALRHGVVVAEIAHHPVATDPRLWSRDRLHTGPLGHARIAAALAHALGVPGSDDSWTRPLPDPNPAAPAGWRASAGELRWVASFAGPWLGRRLRGRSSGDGRTARRPELLPVGAGEGAAGPLDYGDRGRGATAGPESQSPGSGP
ncbi:MULTISPECIES: SGNH/GDSL hydrolase family protein [unclassified Streptomyces]|uniref:SGNH/GDSL hydrolase family protein n=1 Tax=unclassified Streptomyces TaxID=2593676 RepID=UPI001BE5FC66|nr:MULTISPECIES: SGNH/GDSL hydrolase family protein [unclassified Streptomyces]MBT2408803.1 SGNH/GDSL hydrolase family protein [Streptomyces sp. ISL-21]MBT2609020.1 SGNH/GDSL hydrolase family protein [Streptomyces sp. ISL-87]